MTATEYRDALTGLLEELTTCSSMPFVRAAANRAAEQVGMAPPFEDDGDEEDDDWDEEEDEEGLELRTPFDPDS